MVSSGSWTIDAHTLMPRIINHKEFQAEFKGDPYFEAIELMWSGKAEKAMILLKPETSFRARALQVELAYKLRRSFGADASLIESSVMAIKRCQEMLDMEVHISRT